MTVAAPPQPLRAGAVVALAGRRPDAADATQPRFPIHNAPRVLHELRVLLHPGVRALVCSAACGADLLALKAAGEAGIERHVVLPFGRATFRATSVVDRPGDWGDLYDRILDEVPGNGSIKPGDDDPEDPDAYFRANERIVRRALELAESADEPHPLAAVLAWEGAPRGDDDATDDFRRRAEAHGFSIHAVHTL